MESSAGDDFSARVHFPAKTVCEEVWDDACFNAMFSGVSLQSFLAVNHNHPFLPSLFGGYVADAISFPDSTSLYPPASSNFVSESTASSDAFFKLPKTEPMNNVYETEETESVFVFHDSTSFPHLPDLRSLEQSSSSSLSPLMSSSFNKRARVDSGLNPLQTLEPMVRGCESFQNFLLPYQYKPLPDFTISAAVPPAVQFPRSALARQRRQKLSDKTRCLQKLLPWDKKMDIATMLEEAYKYVKFLQAQLLALQSMPCESAISTGSNNYNSVSNSGAFGGLERLNRNQLLQVLVNSPVAQTMLCSQSFCVFSAEQLGLIQKIAEKRALLQQMSTFLPKP